MSSNSLDISYYKKYIGFNNDNSVLLNDLSKRYNDQYHEAISEFDILIGTDRADTVKIDGVEKKVLIDYNSDFTLTRLEKDVYTIQSYPKDIKVGSYVEFDSYTDPPTKLTCIVTEREAMRQGYELGYMTLCNNSLKFINHLNKTIEIPCIMQNRILYSDGLNETKSIILEDGKRLITVAKNEDTIKLKEKQRFIFNNNAVFSISSIDDYSNIGILKFVMIQEEIRNGLDDMDENLADNTPQIVELDLGINSKQLTIGETLQLTPIIKNNGEIIMEELVYTSSNPLVCTVNNTGLVTSIGLGNCNITVSLKNNTNINKTISISIVDVIADNYSVLIEGSNILKNSQTIKLTAKIMNNDVVDLTKNSFVWNIDTTKASIISQTANEVIIKGMVNTGTLTVSCTETTTGTIGNKTITLKSWMGV